MVACGDRRRCYCGIPQADHVVFGIWEMVMRKSATLSDCGKYRYWLERRWSKSHPMVFVMLNPSTANASVDDPTIRRCINFARREDHGGIVVVNLFGLRSTDPKFLKEAHDPVGPENGRNIGTALLMAATTSNRIICAWGSSEFARTQAQSLRRRAADFNVKLMCLGVTLKNHPRHPLYLRNDAKLIGYEP